MKKLILLLIVFLCGVAPALAQLAISIPDTTAAVGDTLLLPVEVEHNQDVDIYGIRAEFSYNTEHLELIQLEKQGSISDSVATAWSNTDGNVVVSLASVNPILDSGVLFYFRITPKIQDISEFRLQNIRINENETENSNVSGQINSITTPVLLSLRGDTTEVRTTARLRVKLSGLLNRELQEIYFTIDYQNPEFQYQGFSRGSNLNETDFIVQETPISSTQIEISITAQNALSQDIELGEIEVFGTLEGEFPIQIVSSEISPAEIQTDTEFTNTIFSEDVTAPEIPQNVSFTKTTENDAVIVALSWEEVVATDFSEYIIIRTEEAAGETLTENFTTVSASLTDSLFNENSYTYTVQAKDSSGNISEKSESVQVMGELVSIEHHSALPTGYSLKQNYPNPFNPVTQIQFEVPTASQVKVEIYSRIGQKIVTLANQQYPAGTHTIQFDASGLPSGMYIYRFNSGSFLQIRKMSLIK